MARGNKREIPQSVRKICYERDNYTCQMPGCNLSLLNNDKINLHHVLPEQFGGKEDPSNLITLCDIHHKGMHVEFNAYYPDSYGILLKMGRLTRQALSGLHRIFGVDDGYDLKPFLQYLVGTSSFRPGQLKTVRAALAGKNVLFVTPTSMGKSVCYQLPGLLDSRPSLIISPLKALMKDQVQNIWNKKIPVTYINSDVQGEERSKRYEFIRESLYKFIFATPERFDSKDSQTVDLYRKYSHLVIDEAHEIEMWGIAFRPSYRKLGLLRDRLGNPPIIALTATASKNTQKHILESLNARDAEVIVTGFYRDNIEIKIHQAGVLDDETDILTIGKNEYIKNVIRENPSQKILIFVPTVKSGGELLKSLHENNIKAEFYHSKLELKDKMQIQNKFSGIEKPEINILISTSAFGMGIDIHNIRHVIHLSPPLSVTDYVQQIGRAGRDGLQSYAHLLYNVNDDGLLSFMADLPLQENGFKEKNGYTDGDVERVRMKLQKQTSEMLDLINNHKGSEWQYILDYFGEVPPLFWDKYGKLAIDIMLIIMFLSIYYVVLHKFVGG